MTNSIAAEPAKKSQGKALQVVLSLIIFAGFVLFLFVPKTILAGTEGKTLSLWGLILDYFKNSEVYDLAYTHVVYALYAVVAFYAVLLIATVISLFVNGKAAAGLNMFKSALGFAAFAYFTSALFIDTQGLLSFETIFKGEKLLDISAVSATNLALALSLVALLVLSIAAYKGRGVLKLIYAVLGVGFFAFLIVDKPFIGVAGLSDLFNFKFSYGEGVMGTITSYVFILLAWAAVLNMALALLGLTLRKTGALDVVRSTVMLILSVAAFVLLGVDISFKGIFDYLGTVCFLGISLVQFIYAIVVTAVLRKRSNAKAAEDQPSFVFDSSDQMAIRGLEQPAAAQSEAPAQAAAAPEPDFANASSTNAAFDDAAQISIDEIVHKEEEETDEYQSAIRDEPAEEPAVQTEEEKPFDFEQAQHDGQFNRDYADYEQKKAAEEAASQATAAGDAAGQSQAQAAAQSSQTPPPPYGMPYYGYGAYAQPYAAQPYAPYGQQAPAYAYPPDAFINSLTPAERDEFDKLFISRVYGENKRLPVYTIGTDNREFFSKIFVFMGRYRNIISEGLLEKIYNYSNSIR